MSLLSRSNKLLSSAVKGSVSLEQAVCRSVGSVPGARRRCLTRRLTADVSSCRVFTRQSDSKRFYSEIYSESSDSKRSTGLLQEEESNEPDRDSGARSRKSLDEKFTLDVLVSLLRQENAVDICVIKVPEDIKYAEYFIVAGGVSPRHLRAMALYAIKVYKFLKTDGDPNVKIEGKDAEDWMCIDFGNMVVHFMLPEAREAYELEKLWTLRSFDEQLKSMPAETIPEDFIYDVEVTK